MLVPPSFPLLAAHLGSSGDRAWSFRSARITLLGLCGASLVALASALISSITLSSALVWIPTTGLDAAPSSFERASFRGRESRSPAFLLFQPLAVRLS